MHAHGAVFAEVKVDPDLGQIRVTRLVGAFAAGRIINPRLVRSQLCGGMIWGVSFTLHEHAVMDQRSGRPMNPNLAEYHIPVNADVPSVVAILVEEHDPHVMPSASKVWVKSESPARQVLSQMLSTTRPESACANSRSHLIV